MNEPHGRIARISKDMNADNKLLHVNIAESHRYEHDF